MAARIESPVALTRNADAIVGIVVALPEELSTLTNQKLGQGECCRLGNVLIAYSGAGMANAAKAAQCLLDQGARQLVSWGCAAGLAPHFKPGDLLIAEQVVSEQNQFDTDSQWRLEIQQTLANTVSIKNGPLFTSVDLVSRSQDKQRIHQNSQAVALDMESAAIAEVATRANVPFLVIRSIADPVSMDLPPAVLAGLNAAGQVELPKLLRHLLSHPYEVVGLIRLGMHFHAAQKTLKSVAKRLGQLGNQPAPIAN